MTRKLNRVVIGLTLAAFILVLTGAVACKKDGKGVEEDTIALKEGVVQFEGTVKVVVGKYMFVPEARGFDLVFQGSLDSGELADLVGKYVRGYGEFSAERPSMLAVDSLEVLDENENWALIYTRVEEVVLEDYLDLGARDDFFVMEELAYDKKDGWEGKEKAKVYGRLIEEGDVVKIEVFDKEGKTAGYILVDSFTDFGTYYKEKLSLFDKFWFYITVKDTVDWKERRRTREMFNADVLFIGLF